MIISFSNGNLNLKNRRTPSVFTGSAPYHYRSLNSSFYPYQDQLIMLSKLLAFTGFRISELLSIHFEDLLGQGKVLIKSLKWSRERIVTLSDPLYNELTKYAQEGKLIFSVDYKEIYRHIKSGKTGISLLKNDKNFSVCHSFRKYFIRDHLYNMHESVDSIVEKIGWLSKTSILYYI